MDAKGSKMTLDVFNGLNGLLMTFMNLKWFKNDSNCLK